MNAPDPIEEEARVIVKDDHKKLFRISVSKYKTFEQCRAKYRFSYLEHLPKKDHDYLVFGKFVHDILERFHKKLLAGDVRPDHLVITDSYKESFAQYRNQLTKDQIDLVKAMVQQYLVLRGKERAAGKVPQVTSAEKAFSIDINDEFSLIGYIDRTQIDPDGMLHVADYKTSKDKKYLKDDFFQLMTYGYIMMKEDESLQKIRTSYIMLKHNFDYITKEFTREQIMKVEDKFIERYKEIMKEGLYRPQPSILCDYCDYLDHCQDGRDYLMQIGRGAVKQGRKEW